ncbi:hypothetical protein, partial [Phocaeicola vulgatus]|uniref:hypothetical protein n=1 Tax=Phocaeicola vulgatus TaxID=821 RepID=UPI001C86B785
FLHRILHFFSYVNASVTVTMPSGTLQIDLHCLIAFPVVRIKPVIMIISIKNTGIDITGKLFCAGVFLFLTISYFIRKHSIQEENAATRIRAAAVLAIHVT